MSSSTIGSTKTLAIDSNSDTASIVEVPPAPAPTTNPSFASLPPKPPASLDFPVSSTKPLTPNSLSGIPLVRPASEVIAVPTKAKIEPAPNGILHLLPARPNFAPRQRSPSPLPVRSVVRRTRSPSPYYERERQRERSRDRGYARGRSISRDRGRSRTRSPLPLNPTRRRQLSASSSSSPLPNRNRLRRIPSKDSTGKALCRYFTSGSCGRPETCRYVHSVSAREEYRQIERERERERAGEPSDRVPVEERRRPVRYPIRHSRSRSRSRPAKARFPSRDRSYRARSRSFSLHYAPRPRQNRSRNRSPSPPRRYQPAPISSSYRRRSLSRTPPRAYAQALSRSRSRPRSRSRSIELELSGREGKDAPLRSNQSASFSRAIKRSLHDRIFGEREAEQELARSRFPKRSPPPSNPRNRSPPSTNPPRTRALSNASSGPRSRSQSADSREAKRLKTTTGAIPTGPKGSRNHTTAATSSIPTGPRNANFVPPPAIAPTTQRNALGIPLGPKNPFAKPALALTAAGHGVNTAQPTRVLWIGTVPWPHTGTFEALTEIFSPFGHIEGIKILIGLSCAFVSFDDLESAINAKNALHGLAFLGLEFGPLKVGYGKDGNATGGQVINQVEVRHLATSAPTSGLGHIPTGPKALNRGAAPLDAVIVAKTFDKPDAEEGEIEEDMPSRGRGSSRGASGPSKGQGGGSNGGRFGGRGPSSGRNGYSSGFRGAELDPPVRTKEQIEDEFSQGGRVTLKSAHAENPKSPLANYMGTASGYESEQGTIDGQYYYRVSIIADRDRGIIGVGDSSDKKEAEKLAAFSAIYQLASAGLVDSAGGKSNGHTSGGGGNASGPSSSGETATLSDGSVVAYETARMFMEYYCQRFHFKKPEIAYEQATVGHGRNRAGGTRWDAIMTVDGRRIGQGSAQNKKSANIQAYLDVVVYLESCDHDLWRAFQDKRSQSKSQDIGTAPHLMFQCSDNVNDSIRQLCDDARLSTLFARAPAVGDATTAAIAAHSGGAMRQRTPAELAARATMLKNRLISYQGDPKLATMRKTRSTLPIHAYKQTIVDTVNGQDVVVLTAATGSGKSTQVGSYILDDWIMKDKGSSCRVVVTQPRRLAALALADRVADERGQRLQQEVGYHVRFEPKLPESDGSITFMTVGILLKRLQSALEDINLGFFDEITHLVIDEIHERDIDTDLLLVILKRLIQDRVRKGRTPPKLILMSATVEANVFQQYFTDITNKHIPILEIPGKIFPVERYYLDDIVPEIKRSGSSNHSWVFQEKQVSGYLQQEQSGSIDRPVDLPPALVAMTIAHVCAGPEGGHLLVFLPGLDEIKAVSRILLNESNRTPLAIDFRRDTNYTIHTLHSTTPIAEQREVFVQAKAGQRRIILSTNIAETSVTIPGITVVIDSGKAKTKIYNPDRHVSSLISAWTGRANLDQRAGRAGRERPGTYIALLSQARFKTSSPHQQVEMLRLDLQEVIMHIKSMRMGAVENVLREAIEPPNPGRVAAAVDQLRLIGAVDGKQDLTPLGLILMHLPCDTKLGKLVVYGALFKALSPALTIAAVIGSRDPFMAPMNLREQANEIKDSFSPVAYKSDTLAVVSAFDTWWSMQCMGRYSEANAFLGQNMLNKTTMNGIQLVREQLLNSLYQANVLSVVGIRNRMSRGFAVPKELDVNADSLPLRAALIALGSAPNFALRTSEKTCRTAHDKVCIIHTSSTNSRKREDTQTTSNGRYIAEKRIYAFAEKTTMGGGMDAISAAGGGGGGGGGQVSLRNVTRLDPLSYLMFGAGDLRVTESGLESDEWLPITGNLDALDDLQRLRLIFDSCFGRIFEGVDQLRRERGGPHGGHGRFGQNTDRLTAMRGNHAGQTGSASASKTTSRANTRPVSPVEDEDDYEADHEEAEAEGDGDLELDSNNPDNVADKELVRFGRGAARPAGKDWDARLSADELTELDFLTSDVVKILDMYAGERDPTVSRGGTRPPSPSYGGSGGFTGVYGQR